MNTYQPVKIPPPEETAHEFNFWVGTWDILQQVLQSDGTWREFPARTIVEPDLDGYVLVEHWEGTTLLPWEGMTQPEPRKALSVRAFDPEAKVWNIYWIDSRNRYFLPTSTGRFENGRGEFFSSPEPKNPDARDRITFSNITANSVDWDLAVLEATEWRTVWKMKMTRA